MTILEIADNCLLRRSGTTGRQKLICLAGFADNGSMFQGLFDTALGNDFDIVAPDLPGFGASPRNPEINMIEDYGAWVVRLAKILSPDQPAGLVGHSIAAAIAVSAAHRSPEVFTGLFSIEGNLTADDAYFSGKAADWQDPAEFKQHFIQTIWKKAENEPILHRYYAAMLEADPVAMWELGRDAKTISVGDTVGHAYRALTVPNRYYWARANTPQATQEFIAAHRIENQEFSDASHWPTVDAAGPTAAAIAKFFAG